MTDKTLFSKCKILALTLPVYAGISLMAGLSAQAQTHTKYCQGIGSTAEAMACVKDHKETAQKALNEVYAGLKVQIEKRYAADVTAVAVNDGVAQDADVQGAGGAKVDPAKLTVEELEKIQKDWLIYRDEQCKWDAAMAESPSLERVYQLSCITDLTEKRTAYLKGVLQNGESMTPREFGGTPRWMNVLGMEHPDVFWRYGRILKTDLNCDEREEYVMTGLSVKSLPQKQATDAVKESELGAYLSKDTEVVLAVADNPVTGKPRTQILRIQLYKDADPVKAAELNAKTAIPALCKGDVSLSLTAIPAKKPELGKGEGVQSTDGAANAIKKCTTILQISDHICEPVSMRWAGQGYEILHVSAPDAVSVPEKTTAPE